jgi:hypothetical protein
MIRAPFFEEMGIFKSILITYNTRVINDYGEDDPSYPDNFLARSRYTKVWDHNELSDDAANLIESMHYVFAQFTDETSDEYVLLQLVLFI